MNEQNRDDVDAALAHQQELEQREMNEDPAYLKFNVDKAIADYNVKVFEKVFEVIFGKKGQ